MLNMTRYTLPALLLCSIGLIVGCVRADVTPTPLPSAPAPRMAETTYVVQRGRVAKTIELNGRISPIEEIPLHFKAPGYVKEVYVQQGDRVEAGDLLAELEMDELLNQIAQAEVELDSAQLLLSKAQESLEQEMALAELDLSVAEAKLKQAEDAHAYAIRQAELALQLAREERARTLALQATIDLGIVSTRVALARATDEVQRAQIEYQKSLERSWEKQEVREALARELQEAEQDREVAQAENNSAIAEGQVHQHDLKMQEIGIQQAEAELERLKAGIDPLLSFEVQRAQLLLDQLQGGVDPALISEVNQAKLALEGLRGHLEDVQIVAPVDGQILSLSLYPGRPVEAFRTVLIIAEPSTLEVAASPTVDQLQTMAEGQRAIVTSSLYPDRTWAGTVRCLPYPYGTCGGTSDPSGSNRSVRIRLEGDSSSLRPGALAKVTVVLQEKEDALWLPLDVIRSFQGRTFVLMQEGTRQQRVDIETGIEGDGQVEILKGLEEGQAIVAP